MTRIWVLFLSLACLPVFANQLSLDWIHRQLNDAKSVEQLLGKFDKKSLERHLLAYHSESQQFASIPSPRVLVYSENADFVMAFNGEPGTDGYNDLEILRFDHQDWKFHPEVIHFDPKGREEARIEAHPTVCMQCHQTDVRPNWDGYFHWVGFYGSEDDNMNAGAPNLNDKLTTGPEHDFYKQYTDHKQAQIDKGEGRYRFLPERKYSDRPNEDFNDRITRLNMRRLLRLVAAHPEAGRIYPHVEFGVVKVQDLPGDLLKRAKHTYQEVLDDTRATFIKARQERVKRHTEYTGSPPVGRARLMATNDYWQLSLEDEVRFTASWRFVFEEIFHEPFRAVSTSFHPDYRVNLLGSGSFFSIWLNTTVDWRGRLKLPYGQ